MYNNHNQISIVGSTMTNFQTDAAKGPTSPMIASAKDFAKEPIAEEPEENIMYLAGIGGIPNNSNRRAGEAPPSTSGTAEGDTDMKNKQISELSDMVKVLLEEQRVLKEKIESQERGRKDKAAESLEVNMMMVRKQREITKKASERTRSQNPQKKNVQSADSKTLHARKMKEQHAIEQAKLDAIENKIERARKRIEEVKVQKSIKAQ